MSRDSSRPSKSPALSGVEKKRTSGRGIGPAADAADPKEAARYIAGFAVELSSLAKRSRLEFLAYLLDVVRMEAERRGSSVD